MPFTVVTTARSNKIVESYLLDDQFILSKIMIAVNTDNLLELKKYLNLSEINLTSSLSVTGVALMPKIFDILDYRYRDMSYHLSLNPNDKELIEKTQKCLDILSYVSTIAVSHNHFLGSSVMITPFHLSVRCKLYSKEQKRDYLKMMIKSDNGTGEIGAGYLYFRDELKAYDPESEVLLNEIVDRINNEIMDSEYPYINMLYDLLPILNLDQEQFDRPGPISPEVALYCSYKGITLNDDGTITLT